MTYSCSVWIKPCACTERVNSKQLAVSEIQVWRPLLSYITCLEASSLLVHGIDHSVPWLACHHTASQSHCFWQQLGWRIDHLSNYNKKKGSLHVTSALASFIATAYDSHAFWWALIALWLRWRIAQHGNLSTAILRMAGGQTWVSLV